jgi:hypothetical protein
VLTGLPNRAFVVERLTVSAHKTTYLPYLF